MDAGGGTGPEIVRVERKPERWRERRSEVWRFVRGTEVRPRRAREAFWRWEQRWARWTRDMVEVGLRGERVVLEAPQGLAKGSLGGNVDCGWVLAERIYWVVLSDAYCFHATPSLPPT